MRFLGGKLEAVEATGHAAAMELAETIVDEGADVVMLLRGEELGEEAAEEIAEDIRRLAAGLVVEVKDGGQPLYPLQMVAE
jgi:dihydroxyacetone kinase-like predicted kinase